VKVMLWMVVVFGLAISCFADAVTNCSSTILRVCEGSCRELMIYDNPEACANAQTNSDNYDIVTCCSIVQYTPQGNTANQSWNPNVTDVCQAVVSLDRISTGGVSAVREGVGRGVLDAGNLLNKAGMNSLLGNARPSWTGLVARYSVYPTNFDSIAVGMVTNFYTNAVGMSGYQSILGEQLSDTVTAASNLVVEALSEGESSLGMLQVDLSSFFPFDYTIESTSNYLFNGVWKWVPQTGTRFHEAVTCVRDLIPYVLGVVCAWVLWGYWRDGLGDIIQARVAQGTSGAAGAVPVINLLLCASAILVFDFYVVIWISAYLNPTNIVGWLGTGFPHCRELFYVLLAFVNKFIPIITSFSLITSFVVAMVTSWFVKMFAIWFVKNMPV